MTAASGPITIEPFDPQAASPAEWEPYHAYRKQRAAEEFPDIPLLADPEFERELQRRHPSTVQHRFVALRAGRIVGNMILAVRRAGTPGCEAYAPFVDVFGGVLKQQRRSGVGGALAAHLHGFMEAEGRTTASVKVLFPEAIGSSRRRGRK